MSGGIEIFEAGDTPVVFDEGFAYVGVSTQRVGVHGFAADPHGLLAWDPERYAGLHVDDNTLSYGIFTEAARAVAPDRPTDVVDPLGGLDVQRLVGSGGSQSAGRLVTYINAVHPLTRVFDGFVPFTWFGSGSSIDDPMVMDPTAPDFTRPPTTPTRIRNDLEVPVIVVNSESETLSVRQPDTDRFRFWEVAGAPHAPRLHMERIVPKLDRDGVGMPGGGAFDGNAIGGIRVPELDAALARHTAAMEEAGDGGLQGRWQPFPAEVIAARYPNQAAYLQTYEEAARRAVEAGVLRPADVADGLARAGTTPLP